MSAELSTPSIAARTPASGGGTAAHALLPASPWVRRFASLIRPGGSVLDLACGSGRHLRWMAAQGHAVTGVDRDAAGLASLAGLGEIVVADLEAGPWPLPGRRFEGIVVTNYLWRALWPALRAALADDAVLIYETFAIGNEALGKPSRPEFLLRPGELLEAFVGLRVVAYEDGLESAPARQVQRIVVVNAPAGAVLPARCRLPPPATAPAAAPAG